MYLCLRGTIVIRTCDQGKKLCIFHILSNYIGSYYHVPRQNSNKSHCPQVKAQPRCLLHTVGPTQTDIMVFRTSEVLLPTAEYCVRWDVLARTGQCNTRKSPKRVSSINSNPRLKNANYIEHRRIWEDFCKEAFLNQLRSMLYYLSYAKSKRATSFGCRLLHDIGETWFCSSGLCCSAVRSSTTTGTKSSADGHGMALVQNTADLLPRLPLGSHILIFLTAHSD